jgi:hypothetical protein
MLSIQDIKNHQESQQETNFLKVLGAGFGRTGTKSLRNALNLLGYLYLH